MSARGCALVRRHPARFAGDERGNQMAISDKERALRENDVRQARASTELEGGRTSEAARAIQDAYARGEIDHDELMRRTRAYLNLPEKS